MCNHSFHHKKSKDEAKTVHDQEHALWNRRSFIQALGLVGGGSMVLGRQAISATKATPLTVALAENNNDNILIIIRLEGGNDGLNTIVPIYDYATYANLRPTIRHNQSDLLNLNADFAIPNYMNSLHFRSTDIWATGAHDYVEPTGWWGRYFEDLYPDFLVNPPDIPPAVQVGNIGNLIFDGTTSNYAFTVANIEQLENVAGSGTLHDVVNVPDCVYGDKLLFLRATANTTFRYSEVIHDAYTAGTNNANYGDGDLAAQLAACARLIKGGLGTKVYMVSIGSFDTHAEQIERHQELLMDLSDSIKAFYDDLATTGMDQKVLSMTISEFGRRPYENGSNGTDHGAASPMLLFGPGLNGSDFIGNHPDLNAWDDHDNLIPTSDFRDIYSTVLTSWFCLEPEVVDSIMLNQTYQQLDLGLECQTLGNNNFGQIQHFTHAPVYKSDGVYIELKMETTAHAVIKLYDLMGREIATLANKMFFPGMHSIDVRNAAGVRLAYGQYIYRISFSKQHYSKALIIR